MIKTTAKFAVGALTLIALAGCVQSAPAPAPMAAAPPVVVQTPAPSGSVVVTPRAY